MGTGRDRDALGRARNSRPRDGLGRPLPYGSPGVPTMPDDLHVAPDEGVRLAQELLDCGRPFHAHEVLESLWKSADTEQERQLWHGLAQLAVGLTHQARGNETGAVSLVERGRHRLATLRATTGFVDLPSVIAWADGWLGGDREQPLRLTPGVGGDP